MKQPIDPCISVDRTITRIGPSGRREVVDVLLREERYELVCNGIAVTELHCMPNLLRELAVGRLRTLGLLHQISALHALCIDEKKRVIEASVVASSAPSADALGEVCLPQPRCMPCNRHSTSAAIFFALLVQPTAVLWPRPTTCCFFAKISPATTRWTRL